MCSIYLFKQVCQYDKTKSGNVPEYLLMEVTETKGILFSTLHEFFDHLQDTYEGICAYCLTVMKNLHVIAIQIYTKMSLF